MYADKSLSAEKVMVAFLPWQSAGEFLWADMPSTAKGAIIL